MESNLPHSTEAEQGVLGAVLLEPLALGEAGVTADWFMDLRHKEIWEAILVLSEREPTLPMPLLLESLKAAGHLARVGGLAYVASLPDCAAPGQIKHYAGILKDRYYRRQAIEASNRIRAAAAEGGEIDKVMDSVESEIFALRKPSQTGDRKASFHRIIDTMEQAMANKGQLIGLSTGFPKLDKHLGGLGAGRFITIAGRPGLGKSSIALNIAQHNALLGIPVGFYSLEMSEDELNLRSIASHAGLNAQAMLQGYIEEGKEMQRVITSVAKLKAAPLHICDRTDLTVSRLRAESRRGVMQQGWKLIVIDYVQLLLGDGRSNNRVAELTQITKGVKAMAKELQVPCLVLAQLNREIEKDTDSRGNRRQPRLADLRESGSIEQDSDQVCLIDGDTMKREPSGKIDVKLLIAKNRHGDTGAVDMIFDRAHTRYEQKPL